MDISIIIVSFNTKELVSGCLDSIKVASSSLPADRQGLKTEVFVVDNNSDDGTPGFIGKNYPWVRLIRNHQNVGFSKANNQALKKAIGRYILILNPDTKMMPDTLTSMIKFMDEHQDTAIATCRIELANGNLDSDCRRHFPTPWRAFCHFSGLAKLFKGSKIFDQYYIGYLPDTRDHQIDSCAGAFMMVKKDALAEVGFFDEDFFFYGEDLDLCFRFKEAGYQIMYTPTTKIIHYKGAASGMKKASKHLSKATVESRKKAILESVRAMELFYQKHYLKKYPFFVNFLVITTVKILGKVRILKA